MSRKTFSVFITKTVTYTYELTVTAPNTSSYYTTVVEEVVTNQCPELIATALPQRSEEWDVTASRTSPSEASGPVYTIEQLEEIIDQEDTHK